MYPIALQFCFALLLASLWRGAAGTNSLVWHKAADRVSADIHGEALWPLLEDIAHQTGWHIFVEPGTDRNVSAKFNEPAVRRRAENAARRFELRARAADQRAVAALRFPHDHAERDEAGGASPNPSRAAFANELLVRVKPGTDIDALAKCSAQKLSDAWTSWAFIFCNLPMPRRPTPRSRNLQNNSDVAAVDYNYYFDPPPSAQPFRIRRAFGGPLSLTLNPPARQSRQSRSSV